MFRLLFKSGGLELWNHFLFRFHRGISVPPPRPPRPPPRKTYNIHCYIKGAKIASFRREMIDRPMVTLPLLLPLPLTLAPSSKNAQVCSTALRSNSEHTIDQRRDPQPHVTFNFSPKTFPSTVYWGDYANIQQELFNLSIGISISEGSFLTMFIHNCNKYFF